MENNLSNLESFIASNFGVNSGEAKRISEKFDIEIIKKGDFFLKQGSNNLKLGFIISGIVREHLILDNQETTKWIATKGYFITDISAFMFDGISKVNFQALTDCEIYSITKKDFQELNASIPKWLELQNQFIAKCFGILETRVLSLLSKSAEERYKEFFHFNKELFNLVPLQYLASMLGMSAETLSRIRKITTTQIS